LAVGFSDTNTFAETDVDFAFDEDILTEREVLRASLFNDDEHTFDEVIEQVRPRNWLF